MVLIVAGLIASFALLLFIFHFAISKTIITIVPQVTVRPVTANILYRAEGATGSLLSTKNTIALKKMEFPIEASSRFRIDAIDPNSAMNARGVVTIYNELGVTQELRPSTRFVTADGLVFRSTAWAKIPASRSLNGVTEMGVLEIDVVADPNDESGKMIGTRGNIAAGTDLTIPGLKFNRDKVYAKAKTDFTGGDNPRVHIVTEEEIQRFKNVLAEQLHKDGRVELQKRLDAEREKTGDDYALLVLDAISFTGVTFEIASGQKIGDVADEIEMRARAEVRATVMDRKATIGYLTEIFRENLLYGTNKELAIHPDTLRVSNIVTRAEDDSEIKATLEMNTSITYDFENAANELTRRLKTIIAGLPKQEAIDRLINEGYVNEVSIQSYPFWVGNVSSHIENIEFSIKK